MKRILSIATFVICGSLFFSCQKVVHPDLNSADPKIVIEAEISDQPGANYVKLTRSVNFDQPSIFPPVTGAVVKLSDNAGNTETLTEVSPGMYKASSMNGVPGRTYTLSVTASNKTYTAVSQMFQSVPLDSLTIQKGMFRTASNVHVHFTDPKGVVNYYRMVQVVNDTPSDNIFISQDLLQDGQAFDEVLFSRGEDTLVTGDSVVVKLQNIDLGAFDYWRTFLELQFSGGQSSSPANPKSNFSNGALGYFSAYAETTKSIKFK